MRSDPSAVGIRFSVDLSLVYLCLLQQQMCEPVV